MDPIKGTFLSADGKTSAAYKIWEPDCGADKARAVIQLSHGMCEYTGRYADYAAHLNALGYIFAGNDHLGHGDTAPDADSLGFIAESDGPELLVKDLHSMTRLLKEKYPGIPFIMLGHSMGSFAARKYLASYAEELDAAIIMGTGGTSSPTGLGMFVSDVVSFFRGKHHRSKLITAMAFGSYSKRCGKGADPKAWLTKDTAILEKYKNDPYCSYIFTAQAYHDLFDLLNGVSSESWALAVPTDMPILLISGDEDPVGNYGNGVRQVAGLLGGAGAKSVTLRLFRGDRHEVLNETDREDVYAYIDGWIGDTLEELAERKRNTEPESDGNVPDESKQ